MEVKIKTLTPLWTGGESGECDRIHETGILGSLRWWMEVLVRGMGGNVCDPTKQKCLYDPKPNNNHNLCDVCQIFGATGWKRRFQLTVNEEKLDWQPKVPLRITPPDRTRGWFLNPGWLGTLQMKIQGKPEILVELQVLLRFIETWGNLGARPQLGYGAFRIIDIKDPPPAGCYAIHGVYPPSNEPDLRSFTFFKLRFTPKTSTWWHTIPGIKELRTRRDSWMELEQLAKRGMIPTTPALKNYLRYHHPWSSPALPHWLFGTIRFDERLRSKVAFSWAYRLDDAGQQDQWEIRGWVYLLQDRDGRRFKDEVFSVFKAQIGQPQRFRILTRY